ncbi:MAG TPA: efflux RND transporter periplasmic adaptor subunit [Gemmatimonadota bacterium]|nr:efflux RND transporter periplasmic adaptor subunit [Gemmatimonadota bacterium]
MSRKKKWLIGIGGLVVVAIGTCFAARGDDSVAVRSEEVQRRDLVARVSATGHIEPKTSVDISADVSGRIVELTVEEGDDVDEGDLLLVIDDARFRAALQRAQASLADARAREVQARGRATQAQRDFERIRDLKERLPEMVTDSELEALRTEAEVQASLLESARHGVAMAQAGVREAEDQLAKTVIRAPMSGLVTRLNVERGETAVVGTMNNPGSLLLTVSDLSVMEAVIEVDETDVPQITIGDSVAVRIDAFGEREFVGRVTTIGNSSLTPRSQLSSDQAIDFEVRVTLEGLDVDLRTDLSATADVITDVRKDVLSIPIIALTLVDRDEFEAMPNENLADASADTNATEGARRDDVEGVYVVEGDVARFRPVEVGIAGDSYFEVVSGLEEGMEIVAGTFQAIRELSDGSMIRVEGSDGRPQQAQAAVAEENQQ